MTLLLHDVEHGELGRETEGSEGQLRGHLVPFHLLVSLVLRVWFWDLPYPVLDLIKIVGNFNF